MIRLNNNIFFDDLTILYLKENIYFLIIGILSSIPIIDFIKKKYLDLRSKRSIKVNVVKQYLYEGTYTIIYIGTFIITMSYIVKGAYNPFIYFNF